MQFTRPTKLTIPQIIVINYLVLLFVGATLLRLPIASQTREWTSWIDAIFTSTSALAVTGQTTLNTATHWSVFGKVVIITLIEIGGIGFVTLWMLYFMMRGQSLTLRHRKVFLESLNVDADYGIKDFIIFIVKFTLLAQLIGAVFLSISFVPKFGLAKGILYAIFHSISAFNNAGFDLFGDSLIGFQDQPFVLFTIMVLIITGGMGFLVWRDILTYNKQRNLFRYTKITLITTSILIFGGALLFMIFEQSRPIFENLTPFEWISNMLFLSVTPRTAGFSNISYANLSQGSLFLTLILMYIGGSSGSTAGGVKTSTIAVACIYIVSIYKGQPVNIYQREIKSSILQKVFLILAVSTIIIALATMILLATQPLPEGVGIEYVLLEVISCISTVGLSMGMTPYLNPIGKLVLITLMFMGRVGLITFLWSIGNHDKEWKIHYPEMNIMVG